MKLRAVVKLPKLRAAVTEIDSDPAALHRLLGGPVEQVAWTEDCVILCNRDWRRNRMEKNMRFCGRQYGGPVLFVGIRDGERVSLSEKSAETVMSLIRNK